MKFCMNSRRFVWKICSRLRCCLRTPALENRGILQIRLSYPCHVPYVCRVLQYRARQPMGSTKEKAKAPLLALPFSYLVTLFEVAIFSLQNVYAYLGGHHPTAPCNMITHTLTRLSSWRSSLVRQWWRWWM